MTQYSVTVKPEEIRSDTLEPLSWRWDAKYPSQDRFDPFHPFPVELEGEGGFDTQPEAEEAARLALAVRAKRQQSTTTFQVEA